MPSVSHLKGEHVYFHGMREYLMPGKNNKEIDQYIVTAHPSVAWINRL